MYAMSDNVCTLVIYLPNLTESCQDFQQYIFHVATKSNFQSLQRDNEIHYKICSCLLMKLCE